MTRPSGITLVTGPSIEPVTVSEAKAYMRTVDATEDSVIASLITAAREKAESFMGRSIISQSFRCIFFNVKAGDDLELPNPRLIDVTQVKGDGDILPENQYEIEDETQPATISVIDNFDRVEVTFNAGYGTDADDVPQVVKSAILMAVAYLYDNRTADMLPAAVNHMLEAHKIYHL